MKKIIAISLIICTSILSANDIELVGKNVLKNSDDIKNIQAELKSINEKLRISTTGSNLIEGDKIVKINTNPNKNDLVSYDSFQARVSTVIRISPSIYSGIVAKVKKGQIFRKEIFSKSQNEFKGWIYVGNGFIEDKSLEKVVNVKN